REDFAFESTLSGLTYAARLKRWKSSGYRIKIVFLRLVSVQLALRRVAARVKQGGHDVPHARMSRADLIVGGRTLKVFTNHWQMNGRYTIIPARSLGFWTASDENKKRKTPCQNANDTRWACSSARSQNCP
ncbi:MAG TPA: hypothetical protein VMO20_00450, partial [Candidatus Acidoferrum sp.]|nr:hypothetical protein [Candidatus Acidoferrum sp.]